MHHAGLAEESPEERSLRANSYALLARLFAAAPDQALLQQLGLLSATVEFDAPLNHAWAGLGQAARGADEATLRMEYQALFIGVTRGEVLPYASWYRTGFLMEKPLADLRTDLARLGYARQPHNREPEDHAAAVCEVMAQLAAAADPRQAAFFQAHIASWMDRFFQDMQTANSAVFYRAAGRLGEAFIAFDEEYMGLR